MSVRKFKTYEDAEKALWNFHPDENYLRRAAEFLRFASRLRPMRCEKGILKFRSIAEANRHREDWELAQAIELQRQRSAMQQSESGTSA